MRGKEILPCRVDYIITDRVQYTPKVFAFPKTTIEHYIQQAIGDIVVIIQDPSKTLLFLSCGNAKKINL